MTAPGSLPRLSSPKMVREVHLSLKLLDAKPLLIHNLKVRLYSSQPPQSQAYFSQDYFALRETQFSHAIKPSTKQDQQLQEPAP